jgi:hypothetical protein
MPTYAIVIMLWITGFSQNVPTASDIIGIIANTNAIALKPFDEMNLDLLFGFKKINRRDRKKTHRLPAKNKLPRETVKALGGTFGESNIVDEPITHKKVNGANNIPKGIVTHLGSGFGSDSSYSSMPNFA